MPCNNGQHDCNKIYVESDHSKAIGSYLDKVLADNARLEASICAIVSELEADGIADDILSRATAKGDIDLSKFWTKHKNKDVSRMQAALRKFSDHEIEIIKRILK